MVPMSVFFYRNRNWGLFGASSFCVHTLGLLFAHRGWEICPRSPTLQWPVERQKKKNVAGQWCYITYGIFSEIPSHYSKNCWKLYDKFPKIPREVWHHLWGKIRSWCNAVAWKHTLQVLLWESFQLPADNPNINEWPQFILVGNRK